MANQAFHNRHEEFTQKAYEVLGILPDRYVFVLTNLCNLNCSFCFQEKSLKRDAMSAGDWINLTKQLPDYARVTLTGGEPLIFPGFRDVFAYVAKRFDCNIISNGLLLTKELIHFVLSFPKFRVLSISLDDVNNSVRGVKADQHKRLESMLKYFVQIRNQTDADCILEAKTIILDGEAENLLEVHKYCMEELGCDHHSFQFLKGSPIQHADNMFEFADIFRISSALKYGKFDIIKQQLELVRQYNIRHGQVAFLHPKIASLISIKELPNIDFINESGYIKENYEPCKFPWSSVHINVDGTLFPCLAVPMGNVKMSTLSDIVNGEAFARFRDVIRGEGTIEACNRCGWLRPRCPH